MGRTYRSQDVLGVWLAVVVMLSITAGISEAASTACRNGPIEVGFLIEGSGDDKTHSFSKSLEFVKSMASKLGVSDSGSHVGLVIYGKKPIMSFDFNEHFTTKSVQDAVKQIENPGKGGNVVAALSFAQKQLFDKSARPDIARALIAMTTSGHVTRLAAKSLHLTGVKVYSLGQGQTKASDKAEGEDMVTVSKPQLEKLVNKMASTVCSGATQVPAADDNKRVEDSPAPSSSEMVKKMTNDSAELSAGEMEALVNDPIEPEASVAQHKAEDSSSLKTNDTSRMANSTDATGLSANEMEALVNDPIEPKQSETKTKLKESAGSAKSEMTNAANVSIAPSTSEMATAEGDSSELEGNDVAPGAEVQSSSQKAIPSEMPANPPRQSGDESKVTVVHEPTEQEMTDMELETNGVPKDVHETNATSISSSSHATTDSGINSDAHEPTINDEQTTNEVPSNSNEPMVNQSSTDLQEPTANELLSDSHEPTANEMSRNSHESTTNEMSNKLDGPTAKEISSNFDEPAADEMTRMASSLHKPTANEMPVTAHEPTADETAGAQHEPASDEMDAASNEQAANEMGATSHEPATNEMSPTSKEPTTNEMSATSKDPTTNEMSATSKEPTTNEMSATSYEPTTNEMSPTSKEPTSNEMSATSFDPGNNEMAATSHEPGTNEMSTASTNEMSSSPDDSAGIEMTIRANDTVTMPTGDVTTSVSESAAPSTNEMENGSAETTKPGPGKITHTGPGQTKFGLDPATYKMLKEAVRHEMLEKTKHQSTDSSSSELNLETSKAVAAAQSTPPKQTTESISSTGATPMKQLEKEISNLQAPLKTLSSTPTTAPPTSAGTVPAVSKYLASSLPSVEQTMQGVKPKEEGNTGHPTMPLADEQAKQPSPQETMAADQVVKGKQAQTAQQVTKTVWGQVCRSKADIGILLDGSADIGAENFQKVLSFTQSLIHSFQVSPTSTHFGLAVVGGKPHVIFDFKAFNDLASIDKAIAAVSYPDGKNVVGESLTSLVTTWFKNSGRNGIPQMLVVVTSSKSQDDVKVPSQKLRNRGVRIQSVGVGSKFDTTELKELSTQPYSDNVLGVTNYVLLDSVTPVLTKRLCRAVGGKLENGPKLKAAVPSKASVKHVVSAPPKIVLQADSQANMKKELRKKLYILLNKLGHRNRSHFNLNAVRSMIANINGHHNTTYCKDAHDLCSLWAKQGLCEHGRGDIDSSSVQMVCPRSCKVCFR